MKKKLAMCLSTLIIIVLLIGMTSCSPDTEAHASQMYTVTMYSGGDVVREWHGVSDYTRFSDNGFTLEVDGTYINVVGDVVIEAEP